MASLQLAVSDYRVSYVMTTPIVALKHEKGMRR